eukprot:5647628-Pleurochrysis_carterae.AAC.2
MANCSFDRADLYACKRTKAASRLSELPVAYRLSFARRKSRESRLRKRLMENASETEKQRCIQPKQMESKSVGSSCA